MTRDEENILNAIKTFEKEGHSEAAISLEYLEEAKRMFEKADRDRAMAMMDESNKKAARAAAKKHFVDKEHDFWGRRTTTLDVHDDDLVHGISVRDIEMLQDLLMGLGMTMQELLTFMREMRGEK